MKINAVDYQVAILFLVIMVGFIARKCRLLNKELNAGITEIILNVTLPFSIIISFNIAFSRDILRNAIMVFGIAVFIHIFSAVLSRLLYLRYGPDTRRILIFATIFDNIGFFGLPVLASIFGNIGIFYGSIYVVVYNIFAWTLGVMIFAGKKELNIVKALTNPALIAVVIGSVLFFFSIKLPLPIFKTLDMIGRVTTPLSMLVIGSMLAEINTAEIFGNLTVYYGTTIRLLVIPLVTALILRICRVPEFFLKFCAISAAMPAGAMTAMFAQKYGGNTLLASRIVFISTLLSIFTIPLLLILF